MNGGGDVSVQVASVAVGGQRLNVELIADAPEVQIGHLGIDLEAKLAKVARTDVKRRGGAAIDVHAGDPRRLERRLAVDLCAGTSNRDCALHVIGTGELRLCRRHPHPRRKPGEVDVAHMPRHVEAQLAAVASGQCHGSGRSGRHAEGPRLQASQLDNPAVESRLRTHIVDDDFTHVNCRAAQIDVAVQAVEEGTGPGARGRRAHAQFHRRVRVDLAPPILVVEKLREVQVSHGHPAVERSVRIGQVGDALRGDVARRGLQVEVRLQTVERSVDPDVDGRLQPHRPDRGKHLADFSDRQGIRMHVESKHRSGAILPDGAVHLQGRFRRVERDAAELKIVPAELHQTDSARDDDVGVSRSERKPGDVEREVARPVSKRQTGLDGLERDRLLTGPGHREGPVVDCDLADRNRPAFGVRLVLLLALDKAPEVPPAGVVMHGDDGTRHVDAIDDDAFRDHVSDAVSRNDPVDRDDREAVHHHAHVVDLHALIEVAAQPSERQRGVEALVQGANDVPAQPLLEPRAFDSHGRHERDAHDDRQDHRDAAEDPEEPAHGQNA